LRAQLKTDLERLPIKDYSVEWSQAASLCVSVARFNINI